MPPGASSITPGLPSFLASLNEDSVEGSIASLIALLKRRQIRQSRPCAIATAQLMRRVVEQYEVTDVASLIKRVQDVGQQLALAQPKELAVGNIVRRILGVIRDEAEEDRDGNGSTVDADSRPRTPSTPAEESSSSSTSSPFRHGKLASVTSSPSRKDIPSTNGSGKLSNQAHTIPPTPAVGTDRPLLKSMFSLLSHPATNPPSPIATPGTQSPKGTPGALSESFTSQAAAAHLGAEVGEAIEEIIDELETAEDQIAGYAMDHIHPNDVVLTHSCSVTVQKFLLKAAGKRKFTVMHAESFPNEHESVHATVAGSLKGDADDSGPDRFHKSLTTAGITVILIPDSAIFAVMSRVNKVVLGTHAVLANGGLIASAGARLLAKSASIHRTSVIVLSGVYKLSPIYPFNTDAFIEYGDAGKVVPYEDGEFLEKVDVENPLHDYVPPELIDLCVTNLGGHAPSYLYRIISDHYREEDTHLIQKEMF